MITKEEIIRRLKAFEIKSVQFDVNGVCNANCWYCPVKYEKHPDRRNTPIQDVKIILDKILEKKGTLVSNLFRKVASCHYNEIVLYPYFEEYLQVLKDRNMQVKIFTNGISLTPNITDLLIRYDVTDIINFNIPAIEKEEWSRQMGVDSKLHSVLIDNLRYLISKIKDKRVISVGMNGYNYMSLQSYIKKLENFPDISEDMLSYQHNMFNEMFPDINSYPNINIYDRDSFLEKHNIFSLSDAIEKRRKGNTVNGCRHSAMTEIRTMGSDGRLFGWLHVNSMGDVFMCCQDYSERTKFGNLIESSLEEIWYSKEHVNVIYESINEGMCFNCKHAEYK